MSSSLTSTIVATVSGGRIGRSQTNNLSDNNYFGYLQDVRVTKGIVRYISNFTPPTAALATY